MAGLSDKSRRELFRGSLEVLVLAVLADGRQYGYALQKRVHAASGQTLKAGSLYPLLHRLEADGLLTSTRDTDTGRERNWYALTPAGRGRLKTAAADWQAAFARMSGLVLPAVRRVARPRPDGPPRGIL